jgi:hypothetical protein
MLVIDVSHEMFPYSSSEFQITLPLATKAIGLHNVQQVDHGCENDNTMTNEISSPVGIKRDNFLFGHTHVKIWPKPLLSQYYQRDAGYHIFKSIYLKVKKSESVLCLMLV